MDITNGVGLVLSVGELHPLDPNAIRQLNYEESVRNFTGMLFYRNSKTYAARNN